MHMFGAGEGNEGTAETVYSANVFFSPQSHSHGRKKQALEQQGVSLTHRERKLAEDR